MLLFIIGLIEDFYLGLWLDTKQHRTDIPTCYQPRGDTVELLWARYERLALGVCSEVFRAVIALWYVQKPRSDNFDFPLTKQHSMLFYILLSISAAHKNRKNSQTSATRLQDLRTPPQDNPSTLTAQNPFDDPAPRHDGTRASRAADTVTITRPVSKPVLVGARQPRVGDEEADVGVGREVDGWTPLGGAARFEVGDGEDGDKEERGRKDSKNTPS